ncbi:ABC transporter family substrate-binding protein [Aestuariimicrobium sp. p3-SID1156]|uniref:ABC transporter family substrate-binding protein n=1 Tax=Aestuariimicrobium sp. p3-SID1156 TaxID=2916038 RepID=UPI00223A79E4|nr:ABC transporter family substrate-binding protein [Aestuariimicrobium sp. p3-SID1156]MCT1460177.1 ABC transporter family substrate-binding protein [Aestuariimicrobium sp. p3-SID1156]
MSKKLTSAFALLVAGSLALSACSGPEKEPGKSGESGKSTSKSGGSVSVMWNQPLFSLNNNTSFGNATANANIVYMTNDGFNYYDKDLNLVKNESFGKYEKVSDDPLTIKLTLSEKAKWSDGTPVTAEDIIFNHGAISGLYNTVDEKEKEGLQNEDGTLKKTTGDKVYFDSSSPSWSLIKEFPVVGDNGKSLTYKYSKPFADWEKTLLGPGLPAHVVAARALGESDATKGKQLVADAFKKKDNATLSKLANAWNSDWNITSMPAEKDKNLLVGSGPMKITDFKKDQYIQLERNENYEGDHKPNVDKITVRYNEDPAAAVSALKNNEVQLISPQSTADILKSLQGAKGIKVETGTEGTYEHVDLTYNNGGPFDPKTYGGDKEKARKVRQAFLMTVPREEIVNKIIKPLLPDATVRNSFISLPGSPNYADTEAKNGMNKTYGKVDIEGAKKLLAEAGAAKPKVRILYAKGNKRREAEFALIKASAEQAGFQVVDNGNPEWGQKLGDKTYDASFFGWQSTSTAVAESQANYITGGLNNYGGYSNPEVDKLYDQLLVETDAAKQKELMIQIETKLVDDAFGLTIFQFPGISAWSEKIQGVSKMSISPTIFWNFWEWKVA